MTTYSEVNAAVHAYNAAAAQCGRSEISWRHVAERCGVQPQVFFDHCDAIAESQRPVLSPDAEALAAAILRDLEEQTAALLSARSNGADPDEEVVAEQETREAIEAEALEENVEANADAEPDPDEELGEIADETFGEEDRSVADLVAEAEVLERSDADGARRILDEAARLGFDDLGTAMLRDAIRASTKLDRSAVNSGWRGAKAKVEREAKQAEKEAKQREAEEAKQREAEEALANAERQQAEAAALREQREERVAPLATDPNLFARVIAAVHLLGVVREDVAIRAVYLTITSRLLLRRVISLLRRGTSASGKNYLIEQTLPLFPSESVIRISGSSAKVLPYTGGDDPKALAHKTIYFPEAAGVLARRTGGQEHEMAPMVRTQISENRLVYWTVVMRDGGQTPIATCIVKDGPTAFIATSARDDIDDELLTRFGFADADESVAQSSMVMTEAFDAAAGLRDLTAGEAAEVELLRDFQLWLEDGGPYDVLVPFAPQIRAAFGRTPRAIRIRRDINALIAAVATSALLHRAQRETDAKGRLVATLVDYLHAWDAFNPGVTVFHNPQQGAGVIALVRALEGMIEVNRKAFEAAAAVHRDYRERHDPDAYRDREQFDPTVTATWSQLARALGLASQDTIGFRLAAAKAAGAVECVNDTAPRSVPRRYRVRISSSDLAQSGAVPVFPTPTEVQRMMNDRAAYERAREDILEEEKREGSPKSAAEAEDEFDVEF